MRLDPMPRGIQPKLARIQAVKDDQHERGGEGDANTEGIERTTRIRDIDILE